ncbi:hypothetical protein JHD48_03850 [Sulfurimonas sp. SAG-AH-194-I05]|nr:hypothetical protein [Sulfurimonas sp. SAG-AH-194-I05]MDF1874864.1 hypothetical protein [Sulfurimonas sp. SAG-AH-194-I05]
MDLFLKHKTVILRSFGLIMLVVSISLHFWSTPPKKLTQNERAAENVKRMEAKMRSTSVTNESKKNESKFLEHLKKKQKKQLEYMTLLMMLFGVGFVGYSFLVKKEEV